MWSLYRVFIIIAFGLACALPGCSNQGTASRSEQFTHLVTKLNAVALSDPIGQAGLMEQCNEQDAIDSVVRKLDLDAKNGVEIWRTCKALYACSPTTADAINGWFESGATFQVGFAELRSLGDSRLGSKLLGAYLPGSEKVYIDSKISDTGTVCTLLLHELAHRFDTVAFGGEESLATEYRAFWYQVAFTDEIYMNPNSLGDFVRAGHVSGPTTNEGKAVLGLVTASYTRKSLLEEIARKYQFEIDMSLIKRYAPLPREHLDRGLID